MKVYTKSAVFLLLAIIGLTAGCKKSNAVLEKTIEVLPPETGSPQKTYLPTQMGTGTTKMQFTYTADQNLTKVQYGDGNIDVLTYNTGGKPSFFEQYTGTKLVHYTEYTLSNDGLVIRGDQFIVDKQKNMVGIGFFTLAYDNSKHLTSISYFDNGEALIGIQQRTYTSAGNLNSEKNSGGDLISSYLYDDQNGLFKNVNYAWLFAIEKGNSLFLSEVNNVRTYTNLLTPATSQNFTYVYNSNRYPDVISSTTNEKTESSAVTYKQIE